VEQVQEEEEEGPGRASFALHCESVSNLPCALETVLHFSGLCQANRSSPAAPSAAPSGWELKKAKFIRACGQELYDDLAGKELVVKLRDAGAEDAIIGQTSLCLLPLLHDCTEVGGEMELKLSPEYYKKWFPDQEAEEEAPKAKAKAKAKAEPKAAAAPPSSAEQPPGTAERPSAPASPFLPPATKIVLRVSVQELVAPAEDRSNWTTVTFGVRGIFALPEKLANLGMASPEEVEQHPLRYRAALLGETLGEGLLAKPVRKPPEADGVTSPAPEGEGEGAEEVQLSEEEWYEHSEQFGLSVMFKGGESLRRYRGAAFVREFRKMLNQSGGVWFYLLPEERPPTDPKRANPPDTAGVASFYRAKAWLDLRALIRRGVNSAEARCPLLAAEPQAAAPAGDWPALETSRAYVRLALELSHDLTPPEHPKLQVDIDTLVGEPTPINKFPDSRLAENMYCEAVERAVELMVQDCSNGVKGGPQGVVDAMKRSGNYEEIKEHLRRTIVSVLRERLRKDTSIVPGRLLESEERRELLAGTYAYLTGTMSRVLDDLRKRNPVPEPVEPPPVQPALPNFQSMRARLSSKEAMRKTIAGEEAIRKCFSIEEQPLQRRGLGSKELPRSSMAVRSPFGCATPEGDMSPIGGSSEMQSEPPGGRLANALAMGPTAARALQVLGAARDEGERYSRLAFEAEMVGRYDRAAQMIQNRLLLDEFRNEPKEWAAYAKFCARSRGRQAAAEEALRQAVQLMAEGTAPNSEETAMEVDLMLSCLLLDRGRREEAVKVLRVWHEKDISDSCRSFLLGLALFLAGEEDAARPLLESVAKPREWFLGLKDDAAVAAKLRAGRGSSGTPPPPDPRRYAACLERLLEFGLPSLAFTFIDQCGTLPPEEVAKEPIALVDAKASALDRDFAACASRLERLLSSGSASREAWRLAGECYLQMQEMDKALQAFNNAISFEQKFDDPVVYVHLGTVLLAKKRWKQASSMLMRSISFKPTAEAWSGVAYAEYRADELSFCYEALCEANLLDGERADVWAQLTLVHLRLENHEAADGCFQQCLANSPDCEELLVEVAAEYNRRERQPSFAEVAARRALEVRDSGQGRSCLADALAAQGQLRRAAEEARTAIGLLTSGPDTRKPILDRALKWCEELGDSWLEQSLNEAQRRADAEFVSKLTPPSP